MEIAPFKPHPELRRLVNPQEFTEISNGDFTRIGRGIRLSIKLMTKMKVQALCDPWYE